MQSADNLILVGLMGAGKTTAGRLLARRLGRNFFDSDQEIERRCGVGVPVIFEIEGEAGFRDREAQVIADIVGQRDFVLATGGGAVLREASRRLLAAAGKVIYLHAKPEALFNRIRHDRNRPLLAGADPLDKLRALYAERDPLYREIADLVIETGMQNARTLARALQARLEDSCTPSP